MNIQNQNETETLLNVLNIYLFFSTIRWEVSKLGLAGDELVKRIS